MIKREYYKRITITSTPGEKVIEDDDKITSYIGGKIDAWYAITKPSSYRIINVQHYTEPSAPSQFDPASIEGVMIIINIAYTI